MKREKGFTLVEVIMVMAVIAILVGIVVGVSGGLTDRQSIALAKGEMETIALGLESFKSRYRDYPWLGAAEDGTQLYSVLAGERVLTAVAGDVRMDDLPTDLNPEPLVDLENFEVIEGALLDPWGNPYMYYYRPVGSENGTAYRLANFQSWPFKRQAFVLISKGPDGLSVPAGEATGEISPDTYFNADENIDNLVFGVE